VGEPAIDLLSRMLAFDPARRCTTEEALQHEWLADLAEYMQGEQAAAAEEDERLAAAAAAGSGGEVGAGQGGVQEREEGQPADRSVAEGGEWLRRRGAAAAQPSTSLRGEPYWEDKVGGYGCVGDCRSGGALRVRG
jgi:hypothetical protein